MSLTKPLPQIGSAKESEELEPQQVNQALVTGLLVAYAGLFLVCWLGLGPQTLAWSLNRALGITSYLALALSVSLGALLGSRVAPAWLNRAAQGGWHGLLSGSALGIGLLHGLLLSVDRQSPQPLMTLLLPGTTSILPLAVGLGTVGMYGLLLVWGSTRLRSHLSRPTWKLLHLIAYPSFCLLTLHGLLAGSDHLILMYSLASGSVVYTFGLRFLDERRKR